MAIPKKGSRKITVDQENYRWLISKKATDTQTDYGDGHIYVAIEHAENPGTTLYIYTDRLHPENILYHRTKEEKVIPVIPSDVAIWIQKAIHLGWQSENRGPLFSVAIENGKMIKK